MGVPDQVWELIRRSWHHRRMRWVFPALLVGFFLASATTFARDLPNRAQILSALVLAIGAYIAWVVTNRVPRTTSGHIGVVVGLVADDTKHQRQIADDFISHLKELLSVDKTTTAFQLIILPQWLAQRCIDVEHASRILSEARGTLILYGAVRRRTISGKDSHLITMHGIVRHSVIPMEVSRSLSEDFRAALPGKIHFPVDNDAFAFEATSEMAEVAARYVIGLAALVSGDVTYAETLLLSVEERLKHRRATFSVLGDIAQRLPARFVSLYWNWLGYLFENYFMTRQQELVEKADIVADKLLAREPSQYQGLLWKSICHFVLRRDMAKAKAAIMGCRRVGDVTWRYSLAFLLAYEGQMKRAREEYHEAFQGRLPNVNVPVQTEEFIHLVLEQEPAKGQLLFASALINMKAKGDVASARRDFEAFLAHEAAIQFPEEVQIAKEALARLPL